MKVFFFDFTVNICFEVIYYNINDYFISDKWFSVVSVYFPTLLILQNQIADFYLAFLNSKSNFFHFSEVFKMKLESFFIFFLIFCFDPKMEHLILASVFNLCDKLFILGLCFLKNLVLVFDLSAEG